MHTWLHHLIRPHSLSLLPAGGGTVPISEPRADWVARVWRAAGLAERACASMTLLAPSDEALHGLGLDLCSLPLPELQRWLMRHLVAGTGDLGEVIETLDGGLLHQHRQSSESWTDAAGLPLRCLGTTVSGLGLRVYVIDRPLEPAQTTLWGLLQQDPSLSAFTAALERTGLGALLDGPGAFTVFAPDNRAMESAAARLGKPGHLGEFAPLSGLDELAHEPAARRALRRQPEPLVALLMSHVVPGRWPGARLPWGGCLPTWAAAPLRLTPLGRLVSGERTLPLLGGSDRCATNGVLHRVSGLLSGLLSAR